MRKAILIVACSLAAAPLSAAELKLHPSAVALTGPHASQRLLVVAEEDGKIIGDVTAKVKFVSSNPAIAAVDEEGTVRAVGDGEAVITATHGTEKTSIKVHVTKTKEPSTPSFRNHVIPV